MSTDTTVSPLRQRMIEDMTARKLGPHSQQGRARSPSKSSQIAAARKSTAWGQKRLGVAANPASIRTEHHLAFTSGLTTVRVVFTNSSASGLSVRFFNVVMAIVPRALAKATGNALSEGCLPGNINV